MEKTFKEVLNSVKQDKKQIKKVLEFRSICKRLNISYLQILVL